MQFFGISILPCWLLKFFKNPGGRDAGETSIELKIGRNWSHTQHTISGAVTAA